MLWAHNNDRVIISMLALHNLSHTTANTSNRTQSHLTSLCHSTQCQTDKIQNTHLRYRFIDPTKGGGGGGEVFSKTETQILLASILGGNQTNVPMLFPGTL